MISQDTIDAIFNTVKVEEVVEDYVKLTKRGVNYKGLCPFHDEKTPSFTVSPTRNIYKCFGCGRGGNAVNFLMEHEGLSYPEALRSLAKKYNIPIEETAVPEEFVQEKMERDSLYLVNQYASDFYRKELKESDRGKSVGLSYFKERGLLLKTIETFELGYAPPGRNALTKSAVEAGYNIEHLRKLGLTNDHDRDFFFDRVMFPIHNLSGKVVAFAGRHLITDKKSPKYVNSKESDIYHKSKVLYGLHLAKHSIRKEDHCLLVEGYTDVISLHQAGITNIVASSGTSLTVEQIRLIKRYTNNIKILYDGDAAGIKAAMRGIDLILDQDLNVSIVLLPDGEDPDSYVKAIGSTAFNEFLRAESKDFILFKTNLILKEAQGDPVKRSELIKDIIISLSHVQDPIKRSVYTRQCSDILEIDESLLVSETNKTLSKRVRDSRIDKLQEIRRDYKAEVRYQDSNLSQPPRQQQATKSDTDEYQEKDIARILVLHGHKEIEIDDQLITIAQYVISNIQDTLSSFENQLYADIITEFGVSLSDGRTLSTDHFINHSNKDIAQIAIEFCSSPYDFSENWEKKWGIRLETQPVPEENAEQDMHQALYRFMLRKFKKMSDENLEQIKKFKEKGDESSLIKHLQVQSMLIQRRNEIAKKLNTVVL